MWMNKIIILVLLALTLPRIFTFLSLVGLHKHIYDHKPGLCRPLPNIDEGAEDIEVNSDGIAFMSSGLHVDGGNEDVFLQRQGRIMMYDFNYPKKAARKVKLKGDIDINSFQPQGISLWEDKISRITYLYVVNHVPGDERIDKFRFSPDPPALHFLRSFRGGNHFRFLNDIVVVEEDMFYFTNFYHYNIFTELHLILRWGSVGFHDGIDSKLVTGGLFCPDGIQINKEHTHIYVAEWCGQNINVYSVLDNHDVLLEQVVPVFSSLNNLNIDQRGDVWAAADPIIYKAVRHRQYPLDVKAPAQVFMSRNGTVFILQSLARVFRFQTHNGQLGNFTEVYAEMESEASSSSAAVYFDGRLLVGSKGSGALLCDVTCL